VRSRAAGLPLLLGLGLGLGLGPLGLGCSTSEAKPEPKTAAPGAGARATPGATAPGPAWEPLYRLAGGDRESKEGRARAERQIERGLAFWRALAGGFDVDDETRLRIRAAQEALGRLDLTALHELLPEEKPGGWREVRYRGRPGDDGRYRFERDRRDLPAGAATKLGIGELALAIRTRPVAEREALEGFEGDLLLDVDGVIGVGDAGGEAVADWLAAMLELACAVPDEKALRDLVRRDLPRTTAALGSLFEVHDLLWEDAPPAGAPRRVRVVVGVAPGLDQRTPRLGAYLEALRETGGVARAAVTDPHGCIVLRYEVRLAGPTAIVDVYAAPGGLLVPFAAPDGPPRPEEAISPRAVLGRLEVEGDLTSEGRVAGLGFDLRGLRHRAKVERAPGTGFRYEVAYDREPSRAALSGQAFGLVPLDVVDILIPSTVEGLLREFLRVFTRGNAGRGAVVSGGVSAAPDGRVELRLESEVPQNALVRFALKVARPRLAPNPEVRAELRALLRAAVEAFAQDFAAVRAPTPPK